METSDATSADTGDLVLPQPDGRERAVLEGGPVHGLRVRVSGRPRTIQVTCPCEVDDPRGGARVEAVCLYRRDLHVDSEPLRYAFDAVSP